MSEQFDILHGNLVYLNSDKAFKEFMDVYIFRGGKYVFKSLFEMQNFYYEDENGKEDKSRSMVASRDGYGCLVDNDEYQGMIDRRNILIDKRISKEEHLKIIGIENNAE